jgi:hypothetical protein
MKIDEVNDNRDKSKQKFRYQFLVSYIPHEAIPVHIPSFIYIGTTFVQVTT